MIHASSVRLGLVCVSRSGSLPPTLSGAGKYPVFGAGQEIGRCDAFNAEAGEIVVGRVGSVGSLRLLADRAWASDNSIVLSPRTDRIDSRYLLHVLARIPLHEVTSGTAMPLLTAGRLFAQRVDLPVLPVQTLVADYLDRETTRIDALVAKQTDLIEGLRGRRFAVIAHRVGGLPARVPLKHRAFVTLGKMLDAGKAAPDGSEVRPYVRAANVLKDGTVSVDDLNRMPFTAVEKIRLDLRAGDVLVVEGGAMGRPAYLSGPMPGVFFQKTVNRVRARPGLANGRFLYYAMVVLHESGFHAAHIDTVSMPHLTAEKLMAVSVPDAPVVEQRKIADELDAETAKIDALIAKAERFIALAKERRAALITAAVTGQIDVRDGAA